MTRTRLRTVALAGLAGFAALVTAQHAWRAEDLPPAEHFVSEYAVGDGGWVQVVAFLAWAASLAATAELARRAPFGEGRRVARTMVVGGVAAGVAGAVACAAFATETVGGELPAGAVKTTAGELHDLGSAFIFFGLLVAAVAGLRLVREGGYRRWVLGLAVLLLLIPSTLVVLGYDAPGWGQRGFIAVGCLWQWRLVQASSSSES